MSATHASLPATTVRLSRPTAKTSLRLLRAAIAHVAGDQGSDFLEVEATYTNVRSTLVHLLAHDRYRTRVEDKVTDLVQMTRHALSQPGIEKLSERKDWVQRLGKATDNLERARLISLADFAVTRQDVQTFIKVVEASREGHAKEHFDASEVVSAPLYVLAHMVSGNFSAYDRTLNT